MWFSFWSGFSALRPKFNTFRIPRKCNFRANFDVWPLIFCQSCTSVKIRTRWRNLFKEKLQCCNLRIIFKSTVRPRMFKSSLVRLNNFFQFKDRVPKLLRSCLTVYVWLLQRYDKTIRHFKVRICEHLSICHLTGKKRLVQTIQSTAVRDHLLTCQHSPSFDNFKVIGCEPNDFKLALMESILINRDKLNLNKTIQSLPLELF